MTNNTLVSPDLAIDEEVQVQTSGGSATGGVRTIRVFGATGSGGGAVDSVTGTGPVIASPTTGAVVLSLDASYPAVADFWPFDRTIPASVVHPILAQAKAVAGPGQPQERRSQAAAAGSGGVGGIITDTLGKSDAGNSQVQWYVEGVADGGYLSPGSFGGAKLLIAPGAGVSIFTMGLGTNAVGAGVAGNEISAFGLINIATETVTGQAPISIQPASTFGGQSFWSFGQDNVTGLPYLSSGTGPGDPVATEGNFRLGWDNSTTSQGLFVQRDAGNTNDLELLSRHFNEFYLQNFFENWRLHAAGLVLVELFNDNAGGVFTQGPFGLTQAVTVDSTKTVRQGANTNEDGFIRQMAGTDKTGTAQQIIASIDLSKAGSATSAGSPALAGLVVGVLVRIVGVDTVTGEWAIYELKQGFAFTPTSVTAGVVGPTLTIVDHSAGGVATVAPTFVIAGGGTAIINVEVGPFAATNSHWTTQIERVVNTGTF